MDMPNVQVQTPSSNATSTASNSPSTAAAATSTGSQTKTGSFVEALIKVVEGKASLESAETSTEVSTDAAAAMVTAILPSAILTLITDQPNNTEEIKVTIQALIQAIQSMNPDELKSLMARPELQKWIANAEQIINQQQDADTITVKIQEIVAPSAQLVSSGSTQVEDLVAALNRYLGIVEKNPTHPIVQQIGSELTKLTANLSEAFPALITSPASNAGPNSVNPVAQQVVSGVQEVMVKSIDSVIVLAGTSTSAVEASTSEGSKLDKPTTSSITNLTVSQGSTSSHTSGDTLNQQQPKGSQAQLLQRLAFTSPNFTTPVETTVVNDVTAVAVDSVAVEHNDTLLPLTQISESTKLAAIPTDVKLVHASVSAEAFAEEMTRFVVKNMSITQLNGSSEAKISLLPENLGQVDVKISIINGQITAHFMAESAHARDLLELQLPQLRASLQQQGLQVDKLNVEQQYNLGSSLFQDQRHQQTSQQSAQNGKRNAKDYDNQFGTDFSIEMDQAVRINRLAYGNTFNATA